MFPLQQRLQHIPDFVFRFPNAILTHSRARVSSPKRACSLCRASFVPSYCLRLTARNCSVSETGMHRDTSATNPTFIPCYRGSILAGEQSCIVSGNACGWRAQLKFRRAHHSTKKGMPRSFASLVERTFSNLEGARTARCSSWAFRKHARNVVGCSMAIMRRLQLGRATASRHECLDYHPFCYFCTQEFATTPRMLAILFPFRACPPPPFSLSPSF